MADELGYDDGQLRKLLGREIVSKRLGKEEKNELAATVALLVDRTVPEVYQPIRLHELIDVNNTVYAWRTIDPEDPMESLADLTLPDDELDLLAKAKPGSNWNLSTEGFTDIRSIAQPLREASPDARRSALMQGYRELLAERVKAYAVEGLGGVSPYARGKKKTGYPSKDLVYANPGPESLVADLAPAFHSALVKFPTAPSPTVESTLVWVLHEIDGRPAVVLGHRLVGLHHGDAFVAQRNFYVGHTFDALLIMAGCFPVGDESVVFYTNRTYTDLVAGFASGAAHSIGRKMLISVVGEYLVASRAVVESQPRPRE